MSWLQDHLEEFVKPRTANSHYQASSYFHQEELTIIKNAWRSIKKAADGKTVLLPGRDVFVFEVLARREDYPTVFVPECSRMTVRRMFELHPEYSDLFLFDTGFAGSIPKALGSKNFTMLSSQIRDENLGYGTKHQVFPRLTLSRGFALKIETTPKYWQSGRIGANNQILQPTSSLTEFIGAAMLTIEVYKNSSPRFIKQHRPLRPYKRRW